MSEYTKTGNAFDPDCRYTISAEAWEELDALIDDWVMEHVQTANDQVQMESWSRMAVMAIRENVVGADD